MKNDYDKKRALTALRMVVETIALWAIAVLIFKYAIKLDSLLVFLGAAVPLTWSGIDLHRGFARIEALYDAEEWREQFGKIVVALREASDIAIDEILEGKDEGENEDE